MQSVPPKPILTACAFVYSDRSRSVPECCPEEARALFPCHVCVTFLNCWHTTAKMPVTYSTPARV